MDESSTCYVLVSNIPADYHTADLRRFFSDFVETGKFECFHFRHRRERPRLKLPADAKSCALPRNDMYSRATCSRVHGMRTAAQQDDVANYTTCCVVKMQERFVGDFIKTFHRKHWLDSTDSELVSVCLAAKISSNKNRGDNVITSSRILPTDSCNIGTNKDNTLPEGTGTDSDILGTFLNKSSDPSTDEAAIGQNTSTENEADFLQLPELRPPNIMPRGNVGTSTQFFLDAIRDCRLSAKLIGKLRLEFPRAKHRRYGQVPLEYEERKGRVLPALLDRRKHIKLNAQGPRISVEKADSGPEDDDDTCEEWERHEALHNDVQANRTIGRQVNSTSYLAEGGDYEQQSGTKQKPYEEEIELVWEKGGSGLNFYTDAQYWKEKEGDFDEQTTDDWDVDMSVYYENDTVHDKDAVDRYDMRRSEFLRGGQHSESVFARPLPKKGPGRRRQGSAASSTSTARVGQFEAHTRGFGSKILKQSGWKEGEGLGKRGSGMALALDGEEDGQGPREKRGVGYHGEQIVFRRPAPAEAGRISTVFTPAADLDPRERLERSNPQLYLKFRDQPVKFLSGGIIGGRSATEPSPTKKE